MRKKIKKLIAMMLAVVTMFTGCASEYSVYADEVETGENTNAGIIVDSNLDTGISEFESNIPESGTIDTIVPSASGNDAYIGYTGTVSGGDAVSYVGLFANISEGGTLLVGNSTSISNTDGTMHVENAITPDIVDGYLYLEGYELDSTVEIQVSSLSGYQIESYSVMTDSGEVVKSVTDFSSSPYIYTDNIVLSSELKISATFKPEEFNKYIDWRASTEARGLYDDEVFQLYIGKCYLGETIEEIIAMYNDPTLDMASFDDFFYGTIFEGFTYEDLLYFYEEGITFDDIAASYDNIQLFSGITFIDSGKTLYQRTYRDKGIRIPTLDITDGFGFITVGDQFVFCLDHGNKLCSDRIANISDETVSTAVSKAIAFYLLNGETLQYHYAAQIYIWCSQMGKDFISAYTEATSGAGASYSLGTAQEVKAQIEGSDIDGLETCVYKVVDVGNDWQRLVTGIIKFQEKGKLTVNKQDETGKALAGCTFAVKNLATEEVYYITTDTSGIAALSPLDYGNYAIYEKSAPIGYEVSSDRKVVTVGASSPKVTVSFTDKFTGSLVYFNKYDKGTVNLVSSGCTFQLFNNSTGELLNEWYGTGLAIRLEGGTYRIHEVAPGDGYLLNPNDVIFTVPEVRQDGIEVSMEDDYTKVEFAKIDEETNKPLSGARLQLQDSNHHYIDEWVSDGSVHYINKLPVGKYYLVETQAPTGYTLADPMEVNVSAVATVQTFTMKNRKTKLSVIKVDEKGNGLAGCSLELWTVDGNENLVSKMNR